MNSVIINERVFAYYLYFMQERMNIFWNKCTFQDSNDWTQDLIFRTYKFTNVYRACDRVSQYLIRNVIYKDINEFTPQDVLLRVLIFKIFNKIETWEYLNQRLNEPITIRTFNVSDISQLLTFRQKDKPIFNNAYMMTGCHHSFDSILSKHETWLTMVKEYFIDKGVVDKILSAPTLEQVYLLMRSLPLIGDFLAYQYSIDFNYTPYLNHNENSFVKAGIGAVRGIKKCFNTYSSYEDAIYYVYDHLEELQCRYGYEDFKSLPNRQPTLIDLQNCFCETDKYLRVKLPELMVGNKRIKQRYVRNDNVINYFFPPKWNIDNINICTQPNIKELTLF